MNRRFGHDTAQAAGNRLGAYRIEGRLGTGGMGEVFLAFDERLQRRVAIKRLRPEVSRTAGQWKRFLAEARSVAQLSHPSIVQVYELLEDGTADCIVMEYVEGCTVARLLATAGACDTALAVSIARQVAEGLAKAHAHDVVHRDLKAENVIVTADGGVKIVDFGLAKRMTGDESSLTERGAILGTYRAMSPEQARGAKVDARSDLFSLGVLIYEMLAGRSPFRGDHPLEVLHQIVQQAPPAIDDSGAKPPAELLELIDRLLEKDPDRRPADARTVAGMLEKIAVTHGLSRQPPLPVAIPRLELEAVPASGVSSESFTDGYGSLPTAPLESPPETPPDSAADADLRNRRRWLLLAAVVTLAAVGWFARWWDRDQAKLRVLVLEPAASEADAGTSAQLSSAVMMALLDGLAALQGMTPLDPSLLPPGMVQPGAGGGSPVEAARTVVADEVLSTRVEVRGAFGQVSLRRLRASDGEVLWSRSFQVPNSLTELPLLTDAVGARLREAYAGWRPEREDRLRPLRVEDHNAFLQAKLRIHSGNAALAAELEQLETFVARSPRFLEAHLLAAEVARILFLDTRDSGYLERSQLYLEEARQLDPQDPRPLRAEFRRALLLGEAERAQATLDELERLDPANPEISVLGAELARQQGHVDQALASMHAAVARYPSWRNLFLLADLEYENGRIDDARCHFEEILQLAPGNLWVTARLAVMEMLFGDLARAEALYRELLEVAPLRPYFTNLGLIHFLRGRYSEAVSAYRQALEIDPEHIVVRLNLADAELARGNAAAAQDLYRRVLQRLETAGSSTARPVDLMNKAQCLAHLGRPREAVEITQKALQQLPDHPEIVFLAAVVYSVAGERASALVNVASALDKGYQARWFAIPAFDPLRQDPEFQALFADDPASR